MSTIWLQKTFVIWCEERRKTRNSVFFLNNLISSVSSGFQWTEFDGFTITFLISFEKRQFIVWMGTTWHIYLSQWVVIWLWFIVWVIKLNCSNILILNCNETCGQISYFSWKINVENPKPPTEPKDDHVSELFSRNLQENSSIIDF